MEACMLLSSSYGCFWKLKKGSNSSRWTLKLVMGIFCNRKANACIFCPLIDLILNFSCVEVLFFQISAIWQHLRSVLQWYVRSNHPDVSVIHSSSDGPCSRYRQRGNFFSLFSELNNRSSRVHEISLRPAVARRHLTVGGGDVGERC